MAVSQGGFGRQVDWTAGSPCLAYNEHSVNSKKTLVSTQNLLAERRMLFLSNGDNSVRPGNHSRWFCDDVKD